MSAETHLGKGIGSVSPVEVWGGHMKDQDLQISPKKAPSSGLTRQAASRHRLALCLSFVDEGRWEETGEAGPGRFQGKG